MAGGHPGVTVGTDAPPGPRSPRRWLHDPRLVTRLPTVLAVMIFAGSYLRYRQRWFMPGFSDYLLWVHDTVTSGTAIAPNQYRPLMPWVARISSEVLPLNLPQAILLIDAALLVLAVVTLHRALAAWDAAPLLVVVALAFGYWFAKLDHWSPETMLLVALVAVVARELAGPSTRWTVVALAGVLMFGARTDFAATLAVTVLAVARARRSWRIAALGAALGLGAVAATLVWIHVFPQAHYDVALIQVPYNLTPGSWAYVLTFYGPALLPGLLLLLRDRVLPTWWPVFLWFLVQFAVTFVVGRVDEVRIFMPFAAALATGAVLAYRELVRRGAATTDRG